MAGTVIGDTELLDLWERSLGLDAPQRSLVMAAAAAGPGAAPEELAERPLGELEALLLELRCALAGPAIEATAECPGCGTELEFTVDAEALLATVPVGTEGAAVGREPRLSTTGLNSTGPNTNGQHTTVLGGHRFTWRSPTAADLAASAAAGGPREVEADLLRRCVTEVEPPADPVDALDDGAREALAAAMEEADPLAEVVVALDCGECGGAFSSEVDVAEFAWAELHSAAMRLLWEVDALARAYGWSEPEVLALSPARRRWYLEMAVPDEGTVDGG